MDAVNIVLSNGRIRLYCSGVLILSLIAAVSAFGAEVNPHWKAGSCNVCHSSDAPTADNLALKTTPGFAVCSDCHDGIDADECRHRSGIAVDQDRVSSMDALFQPGVADGQVGCTTCHEMAAHCARDIKERYRNPTFLRGAPFDYKGDQCFACHDKSYRQPSPHRQGRGARYKENFCVFCHGEAPQMTDAGEWMPVQFATEEPLSQLCSGCHTVGPHPSSSVTGKRGWFHMSAPDAEFKERMAQTVDTLGGRLPLDPNTGEMTCATCHDPHDGRLDGFAIADPPGSKVRLRYEDICGACHEK